MDAVHLQILITDADATLSSGLLFYFASAAADAAMEAAFSATTVTADAIAGSGSCYFSSAAATMAAPVDADANPITFSFHHV